ncbi:MAG TPA: mechanosensitive ion channel domain-containing protein [Candidatus Acidoferrum sp.]|nr:mechanosensitive ion channel domain-containing protein [Candidatus Acidoferrum sp.]
MKPYQKILAITLVLLLGATVYGLIRTSEPLKVPTSAGKGKQPLAAQPLVDQTPMLTAEALAQMPTSQEELAFAQQALDISDKDMDVAYTAAKRELEDHPVPLSPEAKQIQARLNQAEDTLAGDDALVERLTAQEAKATGARKDDLGDQLILAQAKQQEHQDDVDDAKGDLARAGGDSTSHIEALTQEHETSSNKIDALIKNLKATPGATNGQAGLMHRFNEWWALHQKQLLLWQAKQQAESAVSIFSAKHNALEAQSDTKPGSVASTTAPASTGGTTANANAPTDSGQQSSTDLVNAAKQRGAVKKTLSSLDKRIDNEKQLATTYSQWISVVAANQRAVLHRILIGLTIILAIALFAVYFATLMDKLVGRLKMDRRQLQSLHTLAHVAVRIVATLLILLVIIGPPGQLGTFLGLAGAGLTVALKDFIVGFLGWFVLMGKNGIRMGDWVEINGVTGEVVEIGPFHTVLLETGNWTDSGHPTGRRVTFTNSFAIEGHYFNFSTTGQWLWDELQLVLPLGQDPYPLLKEIRKRVSEATKEKAQEAEAEWRRSTRSREMSSFSVEPAISVKPVVGGVEVAVRYITRANERYQMRSKLYQDAVDLLGGKSAPASAD